MTRAVQLRSGHLDRGPPGEDFAVSQTTLYSLAPDSSYVSQYEPGVGWVQIGGPASGLIAGG